MNGDGSISTGTLTHRLGRRDVLRLSGVGLTAATLSGCSFFSTAPTNDPGAGTGASGGSKGKEAPVLAEAVEKGDLPAVEERLPKTPLVVQPSGAIGQYGGDLRLLMSSVGGDLLNTTFGYEGLVRWKPDATQLTQDQVIANVAETFEASEAGDEFTFTLRDQMKWSDGEPFTADDIMFWYSDVAMNSDLSPAGMPEWLDTGGDEPLVVEKVDDRTVVFRFSAPNGLFLINMATQRGDVMTAYPAHYLKPFHKLYADADELKKQVKEAEVNDWTELFTSKASRTAPPGAFWENADVPTLNGWLLTKPVTADSQQVVAERNPYYFKTDPEGSQLPYLDRVTYQMVTDAESSVLKVTNGEIDLVDRGINTLRNKPVFADAREKAGIDFFDTIPQQMNQMIIMLNLTHKNKALREIFNNLDFRIGLSHALNRQEIIDTVFSRQGEPWQAAPRPESPHYNETLAKQYTEYDAAKAAEHLDKVLPDKDSDGLRLRPDGKPLSFQVEVSSDFADLVDALEFVKDQWQQVGIKIGVKSEDGTLFGERMDANEHDACVWIGGGGLGATLDPFYYVPYNFNTRYAMPWFRWVTNPDDPLAEAPPQDVQDQVELYRELQRTGDEQQQIALMKQITDFAAKKFYCMGVALRNREYGVASTRLKNVPDTAITGWLYGNLMPTNPQQFFVSE